MLQRMKMKTNHGPMKMNLFFAAVGLSVLPVGAWAQSSSFEVASMSQMSENRRAMMAQHDSALAPMAARNGQAHGVSLHGSVQYYPGLKVVVPPPVTFEENSLVTIIIRESMNTDLESELTTEVGTSQTATLAAFPQLTNKLQLTPGVATDVELDLSGDQSWEGEGEKSNSNSVNGRITARVAEVLPNGSLVLEARKFLQHDEETLEVVLSGTCRAEDIDTDNTILSTQIYGLVLKQTTEGELRKAQQKGVITRVMDAIFNF